MKTVRYKPRYTDRYTEPAVVAACVAWHDLTCPEGVDCRAHNIHADPRSCPVLVPLLAVVDAVQAVSGGVG